MIPPEVQYSVFNSVAIHDPFFDRLPAEDFLLPQHDFIGGPTLSTSCASELDMFPPPQEHYPFRRMSADTQSSGADSTAFSPNQKPAPLTDTKNVVLPPILSLSSDIPRPISPEANSSDASSSRSPPLSASASWHAQHQQSLSNFQFPPLDPEPARHPRPQLSINPDQQRQPQPLPPAYPTPNTAASFAPTYPAGIYSPNDRLPASAHSRIPPGYLPSPATGSSATSDASKPHFEQLMLTGDVATYPSVVSQQQVQQQAQPQVRPPSAPTLSMGSISSNPLIAQHPQRRRGKLPKPVTEFLKKWLLAHTEHPYPTEDEKKWLCSETGLSMSQVSNWMINARRRILAPAAKANAAAATTTAPYFNRPGAGIRSVSAGSTIGASSPTGMGSYIPNAYNPPPAQTARRGSYGGYGTPVSSRPPSSHPSPYGIPSNSPYTTQAQPVNGGYGYTYPPPPTGLTGPGVYSTTYPPPRDMAQGSPHAQSPAGDYAFPAPAQ